jgi:AraC-like DNA-binding protein
MTLCLTIQDDTELWERSAQETAQVAPDGCSEQVAMPPELGKGYDFYMDLYPDCWLKISNHYYHEDYQVTQPEWDHPVQFGICLSGMAVGSQCGTMDNSRIVISGAGVQRENTCLSLKHQPYLNVNLEMSPERFITLFPDENGELPAELRFLVKGNDWQTLICPKTSPAIQRVAQEIMSCPYTGAAQRLHLQGKSQELMALILAPIVADQGHLKPSAPLKPMTIAQIYTVREQLQLQLDDPPSSLELAQQVGLSHRTLQRGFKAVFDTTIAGYVAQQRLLRAEQLLRSRSITVTEVAHQVGYSHLGHFATAFKRKFGISPSDCVLGRRIVVDGRSHLDNKVKGKR